MIEECQRQEQEDIVPPIYLVPTSRKTIFEPFLNTEIYQII